MQPRERKKESKNFDSFAGISTRMQERLSGSDFGFCCSGFGFGFGFDYSCSDSGFGFGSDSGFDFDFDYGFPWFTSP